MASLQFRKLLLLYIVSFLCSSILVCALSETDPQIKNFLSGRRMLEMEDEEEDQPKKKSDLSTKKQSKLIKPKPTTNSTKKAKTSSLCKTQLKKLSSTSSISNSPKPKSSDLLKLCSSKNKTSKLILSKKSEIPMEKQSSEAKSKSKDKLQSKISDKKQSSNEFKSESSSSSSSKKQSSESKSKKQLTEENNQEQSNSMDQEEDEDEVTEAKELPSKVQQSMKPDQQKMSTNSKTYLVKPTKEITNGFKPFVGTTISSILACVFIIFPLLLVSLILNRNKAFLSLQKILIYIQVYLSIYFLILSLSSLVTGMEPLKFFYATSQSSYVFLQVLQTLGYVLYLLLLLMYLVVVLSTESGLSSKFLGLGQTMVGIAVGLHYYGTVFHRAVQRQPPKTSWKVEGIYGICFIVVCLFAGFERRKKAYLQEVDDQGKKH
ncbi:hypothetical protein NE237_018710 [Protea cynaroides]|uniref:Transmembrane protein n=1 Tax=Protea cynaroides TaxID=273540 RepID=A0A9Q0KAK7_9MAGN|nr:hypothetical protein NE237_018710 [Protea cynaroides]